MKSNFYITYLKNVKFRDQGVGEMIDFVCYCKLSKGLLINSMNKLTSFVNIIIYHLFNLKFPKNIFKTTG